jgi:hypothetical protein
MKKIFKSFKNNPFLIIADYLAAMIWLHLYLENWHVSFVDWTDLGMAGVMLVIAILLHKKERKINSQWT